MSIWVCRMVSVISCLMASFEALSYPSDVIYIFLFRFPVECLLQLFKLTSVGKCGFTTTRHSDVSNYKWNISEQRFQNFSSRVIQSIWFISYYIVLHHITSPDRMLHSISESHLKSETYFELRNGSLWINYVLSTEIISELPPWVTDLRLCYKRRSTIHPNLIESRNDSCWIYPLHFQSIN